MTPRVCANAVLRLARVLCLLLVASVAQADDKAVVLIYHHVATDTPASTSVSPQAFIDQVRYLAENEFNVWPLHKVLRAIEAGQALPARTVVITFDDAYKSVYTTAWPKLAERGWPFTVFVSTDAIDQGLAPYMSWEELDQLARAGIELGNHSASHFHPHDVSHAEFRADLRRAQARLVAKTATHPTSYAYPYGEYDSHLERIVAAEGLYGIAQQSGVLAADGSLTQVPRFPISTTYAKLEDFALRVNAYPLPVAAVAPDSRVRRAGDANPLLVLQATDPGLALDAVSCFSASGRPIGIHIMSGSRFSLQDSGKITRGRSKYTCTAKLPGSNAFAWYSHLWIAR